MINTKIQRFWILIVFLTLIIVSTILYANKKIDDKLFLGFIGSLISALYGIVNFQIEHDKMFNQLFTDFNKRYTDDQNDLINALRNDSTKELTQKEKNLIFDYFNLCAEEYLWFKKGRIPKTVWKAWKNGILENLKIPIINEMFKSEISTPEGRNSFYGLAGNLKY